jgi:hypothetical protein
VERPLRLWAFLSSYALFFLLLQAVCRVHRETFWKERILLHRPGVHLLSVSKPTSSVGRTLLIWPKFYWPWLTIRSWRPSSPGARWKRRTPFSMSIHICISWKAAMGESRCTLIMRFVHGWIAFETNPFSLLECWSILIYLKGFQFPAHVEINLHPSRTWVLRLGFRVSAPNADICIRSVCKEAMQVRVPQLWQFHFVSACRFWSTAFRVKASNARYLGKMCAKRQCRIRVWQSWQFCFVSTCTFWFTSFSI